MHNAWTVDFNLPLRSFEDHVAGTRKLLDFCHLSSAGARLLFTSSVSVAGHWDVLEGPVPEKPMSIDGSCKALSGYAASKLVVEQVSSCDVADSRIRLQVQFSSVRCGY